MKTLVPAIAAFVFFLCVPGRAQGIFQLDQQHKTDFPRVYGQGFAVADFDRDRDLDVVVVSSSSPPGNQLLANRGNDEFVAVPAGHAWNSYRVAVAGDVDLDGDVDLVVGTYPAPPFHSGQTRLFLNAGSFSLREVSQKLPKDADWTTALVLVDVDGDRDLDLVLGAGRFGGTGSLQTKLYRNDGRGTFTDVTAASMPKDADDTQGLAAGDVDGDGDVDLVIANGLLAGGQQNKLYLNDGKGRFTDATKGRMPALAERTAAVALVDLDSDGDLDLVAGNGSMTVPNRVWLNSGKGTFLFPASIPAVHDFTYGIATGDVDGDGDVDLMFANQGSDRLLLNNGRGLFVDGSDRLPRRGTRSFRAELADFDGDGDLDLFVLGNWAGLFLNDGTGRFFDTREPLGPGLLSSGMTQAAAGDFDGDGDSDLVFARGDYANRQNDLFLGEGTGRFRSATATRMPPDADVSKTVVAADFDGDGDLDVAFGNWRQRNTVYLNDGKAKFSDVTSLRLPKTFGATTAIVAGDIDGDRDADLVIANEGEQNRVWVNDGRGRFRDATAQLLPRDADHSQGLALVDVDRDGDLDLVLANGANYPRPVNEQNRLYLNDGKGRFTDATGRLPRLADMTFGVSSGDVDGDGDPDLVFGNSAPLGANRGQQNRLYLNDGSGRFRDGTAGNLPADGLPTREVRLVDVDLDGRLDLVYGTEPGPFRARLLLGDGRGRFTDMTGRRWGGYAGGTHVGAVDVDGDGDPDLLLDGRLWTNRHRQVWAPRLARLGRLYVLEFLVEPNYAKGPRTVLPMLGFAALRRGVSIPPFGTLRLDPARSVVLPPLPVSVRRALAFPVPNDSGLLGRRIFSQGLVMQPQFARWRLTNLMSDVLFR